LTRLSSLAHRPTQSVGFLGHTPVYVRSAKITALIGSGTSGHAGFAADWRRGLGAFQVSADSGNKLPLSSRATYQLGTCRLPCISLGDRMCVVTAERKRPGEGRIAANASPLENFREHTSGFARHPHKALTRGRSVDRLLATSRLVGSQVERLSDTEA
jgi:hypothetical protein